MELIRGNKYLVSQGVPINCETCKNDVSEVFRDSVLLYLGVLDGYDFFIYDQPPQCPHCRSITRYHIAKPVFDVTEEFRKLLDKKI